MKTRNVNENISFSTEKVLERLNKFFANAPDKEAKVSAVYNQIFSKRVRTGTESNNQLDKK
jgi:hypothetical protein